ncbi:MAG: hypothetical protein ACRC7H_06760 [Plesiomonas shigelloides]
MRSAAASLVQGLISLPASLRWLGLLPQFSITRNDENNYAKRV